MLVRGVGRYGMVRGEFSWPVSVTAVMLDRRTRQRGPKEQGQNTREGPHPNPSTAR